MAEKRSQVSALRNPLLFLVDKRENLPYSTDVNASVVYMSFAEYKVFIAVQMYIALLIAGIILVRRLLVTIGALRLSELEMLSTFIKVLIAVLFGAWLLLSDSPSDSIHSPLLVGLALSWRMFYLGAVWFFALPSLLFLLTSPALSNSVVRKI
ncbi:hypothetical protein FGG78_09645 [Thioclava sp. BHET1]|nr:hypothetical protein FGG78_09645 [Thioclava sp. BHET1]